MLQELKVSTQKLMQGCRKRGTGVQRPASFRRRSGVRVGVEAPSLFLGIFKVTWLSFSKTKIIH